MASSPLAIGSTAKLYLSLINSSKDGLINESPTVAIQRLVDSKWFQASDKTWQTTIVENPMTQLDTVNLPGLYVFDFDQSADDKGSGRPTYIAKMFNSGSNKALRYEELVFGGAPPRTSAPNLCEVSGSIFTPQGEPAPNILVRATLVPLFKDGAGRSIQSRQVTSTHTDQNGDFAVSLVRGGTFRLEIEAIGYQKKVTIPDQSSVQFTDL